MEKILTISIAAYNVAKFLNKTLDSLLVYECLDSIEVLIINDGSNDATSEIAQRYVDMYPNTIKLVNKKNGGWGSTVNTSIELSTGKYFKVLDGDDWFDGKNLNKFVKFLAQTDVDVVLTQYTLFYDGTDKTEKIEQNYLYNKTFDAQDLDKVCMHALTVKTEILKKNNVKLLTHCFYTDLEFFVRSVQFANSCESLDMNIYCYRVGRDGQSVSPSSYVKHIAEHERVIKTVLSVLDNNMRLDKLKTSFLAIAAYHVSLLMYLLPTKNNLKQFIEYKKYIKTNYPEAIKFLSKKALLVFMFPRLMYKPACKHKRRKAGL